MVEKIYLPVVFPVELSEKGNGDVLAEHIRQVVKPIFEENLHRKRKTELDYHMGILWRPNNYRRKCTTKVVSDIPLDRIMGVYQEAVKSQKKMVYIRDYPGLLLIVGRRSVTGVWMQERIGKQKAVYSLRADSMEGIQSLLELKKESIRLAIDAALLDFMDRFGLADGSLPIWERSEDWIRDSGYKVPMGSVVYLDGAKKVYEEGLEFTTRSGEEPLVGLSSFLENRSLEKIAPQVAAEIAELRRQLARNNAILAKATILIPEKSAPAAGQRRLSRWFDG